jgi:MFS family permease
MVPLVVADLMRGNGGYNLAFGAIDTAQGIGASLSGLAAGLIVGHFGYDAAFVTSGTVAFVAPVVLVFALPETAASLQLVEAARTDTMRLALFRRFDVARRSAS